MRKYIDPEVKLIDKTEAPRLNYYVWLKSRRKVIKTEQGDPIKDVHLSYFDTEDYDDEYRDSKFPPYRIIFELQDGSEECIGGSDKFYVDGEEVTYKSYLDRIDAMSLQYNNMPYSVFEIQGSALFRDFLFNVNWTGMWSESNRFLFSILPDDAVLNEENYHISSEYKGIPEWEDQFDRYMDKIHETQITDENRVEMPYSISSFFWWSCNRKTLLNVLSLMKLKFPFFYEVYGKQMMDQGKLTENDLKPYVDASLQQYFRSPDWEKGMIKKSDMYIIDTEISYIILSQFLRQAPSVISGLYSDLEHDSAEEFSHKVFKGDTVCKISFTCHKSKLMKTVSTRSCNFAANSGTGVGSWSGFLNDFISGIKTTDEFRELVPCKFYENGTLKFCPLYDDIKFRNSGTESRNCVCPFTTVSMEDAQKKLNRDQNLLAKWFYEVTKEMVAAGGKPYVHDLKNK